MRFTFLHTADLHLDSPMRGLSARRPELASLFAGATRRAFTGLIDQALSRQVAFVLIAGDIYDGDWKDYSAGLYFTGQMARLARAGIPAFLIRGNHDAESQITRTLNLPEGVHMFGARKAETRELPALRVAVHGRSFAEQAVPENLAQSYPPARPGWFNIGLLHTSLDGRPGHAPYAPCSVADLALKAYDYWALGHIHAAEIVARNPCVVYPGNIQGRHVRETGAKGAMLVTVEDGQVAALEAIDVDVARWARLDIDIDGAEDLDEAIRRCEAGLRRVAAAAEGRPTATRLHLSGASPAHRIMMTQRAEAEAEILNAASRISDLLHVEKIEFATQEPAAATPVDLGLIDPKALIDGALAEPTFQALFAASRAEIIGKLPDEVKALINADDADDAALLAEAHDLALGLLQGPTP